MVILRYRMDQQDNISLTQKESKVNASTGKVHRYLITLLMLSSSVLVLLFLSSWSASRPTWIPRPPPHAFPHPIADISIPFVYQLAHRFQVCEALTQLQNKHSVEHNHAVLHLEQSCPVQRGWRGVQCYTNLEVSGAREEPPPREQRLQEEHELHPLDDSLFFLEESCAHAKDGDRGVRLSWRKACSVEAAARLHPRRTVYLLVASASWLLRNASHWSPAARALLQLRNVEAVRVLVRRLARGTPLFALLQTSAVARGRWVEYNARDLLRTLVLYRFGGVVLDFHALLLRSLDGLTNFFVRRTDFRIGLAAMGLTCDEGMRRTAKVIALELLASFDCSGYKAERLLRHALVRVCGIPDLTAKCRGISLLPPAAFYPPPLHVARLALDANASLSPGTYAFVWSGNGSRLSFHSKRPHAQLARKLCPSVVAAVRANESSS